jgi:hypothetical protein
MSPSSIYIEASNGELQDRKEKWISGYKGADFGKCPSITQRSYPPPHAIPTHIMKQMLVIDKCSKNNVHNENEKNRCRD